MHAAAQAFDLMVANRTLEQQLAAAQSDAHELRAAAAAATAAQSDAAERLASSEACASVEAAARDAAEARARDAEAAAAAAKGLLREREAQLQAFQEKIQVRKQPNRSPHPLRTTQLACMGACTHG